MRSDLVEFRNNRGWRLVGSLLLPAGAAVAVVVFAHGLGSDRSSPRNVTIAARLLDKQIASLLMDLSGHGESEGDPEVGLEQFGKDIAAAVRFIASDPRIDGKRIGVAGSSLGGTAALYAVTNLAVPARALVLRAPPLDSYAALLARLTVPTLVIVGSEDPLLPMLHYAARRMPSDCALKVIHGGGHLFEEPHALEEMVSSTVSWFVEHLSPRDIGSG